MKSPVTLFLFLLTLSTCAQNNEPNILIKENKNSPATNLPLSELMEFKSIIPLETTGNSVIGNINEVLLADNKIFILDSRPKSILVFDLEGSFIRRIGSYGNGPGEYNGIVDFDVLDKEISLLDHKLKKIITYDLQGNLINELKLPSGIDALRVAKLEQGDYLIELLPHPGTRGYALAQISREGEVMDKFLPNTSIYFMWNLSNNNEFFRSDNGSIRFIPAHGNIIYSYKDGDVRPFIELNPSQAVVNQVQFEKASKDIINMRRHMKGMWGFHFYNENKSYINFMYHLSNSSRWVFIRKDEKVLKQENVQFYDDYFGRMMDLIPVFSNDSINVFSYLPTGEVNSVEAFKSSNMVQTVAGEASEMLQERLRALSIESNPVLIVYKLK